MDILKINSGGIDVTVVLALRGCDGIVLATDSKITGTTSADASEKIVQVNRDIGIITYGLTEPGHSGMKRLVNQVKKSSMVHFTKIASLCQQIFTNELDNWLQKQRISYNPRQHLVGYILAGYDSYESNHFQIIHWESPNIFVEEENDIWKTKWHIRINDLMSYAKICTDALIEFAIMDIIYTRTYDNRVGGPIQIAKYTFETGFKKLDEAEVNEIIKKIQPKVVNFRRIMLYNRASNI